MEMFELRYFSAVAKTENIHRASEDLGVSPASLSKAVARLEEELQVNLFFKAGRNIKLTPEGHALKLRAADLLKMEEDTRLAIRGGAADTLNIQVGSEEILQTRFGPDFADVAQKHAPGSRMHFLIRDDEKVIRMVREGELHFGWITSEPPADLASKLVTKVEFKVFASEKHPLLKRGNRKVPIDELLKHPFVVPDTAVLGRIKNGHPTDGWRDDKFPRRIAYRACGLKLIEDLVKQGRALAYLPDYFSETTDLRVLNVEGCSFTCQQQIRLICREPERLGWTARIWHRV